MSQKFLAVIILAAISCSLCACNSPKTSESSVAPSSSAVLSNVESSASSAASSASSAVSSAASSAASKSSASKPAVSTPAPKKVFTETQKDFTFKDGVYSRIYGNRAFFIVTKDPASLDDKAMNDLAKSTAGDYYKNDYYCTVCFVKPDKKDGTFNMTETKSDNRTAAVFDMHHPNIEKITINLKENPLQEYIDKQFKKAEVKK